LGRILTTATVFFRQTEIREKTIISCAWAKEKSRLLSESHRLDRDARLVDTI
jgi:hypothetical protein